MLKSHTYSASFLMGKQTDPNSLALLAALASRHMILKSHYPHSHFYMQSPLTFSPSPLPASWLSILNIFIQQAKPHKSRSLPLASAPPSHFLHLLLSLCWSVPLPVGTEHPWSLPPQVGTPAPLGWSVGTRCPCWWGNLWGGYKGSNKLGCWKPQVVAAQSLQGKSPLIFPWIHSQLFLSFLSVLSPRHPPLPPVQQSGWRRAPDLCRGPLSGALKEEQSAPGLLQEDEPASNKMIWWWGELAGSQLQMTGLHCTAGLVAQHTTQPKRTKIQKTRLKAAFFKSIWTLFFFLV